MKWGKRQKKSRLCSLPLKNGGDMKPTYSITEKKFDQNTKKIVN